MHCLSLRCWMLDVTLFPSSAFVVCKLSASPTLPPHDSVRAIAPLCRRRLHQTPNRVVMFPFASGRSEMCAVELAESFVQIVCCDTEFHHRNFAMFFAIARTTFCHTPSNPVAEFWLHPPEFPLTRLIGCLRAFLVYVLPQTSLPTSGAH